MRRVVRCVVVVLVVVLLVGGAIMTIERVGSLGTSGTGVRPGLVLALTAGVLRPVGLSILLLGHAVRFTTLRDVFLPFTPPTGLRRTVHGRSGLFRQAQGGQPLTAAELPRLRAHAKWQLALGLNPVITAGMIIFLVGMTAAPLDVALFGSPAWSRGLQMFSGVLLVVFVAGIVLSRGNRRRAQAFLDRTSADQ